MQNARTLAQRLLLSRRELGLDQKELGRRAGVSNSYISDIERERITNVGVEVLSSLSAALGVSPEYLAGWQEDPLNRIPDDEDERVLREASPAYHVYSEEERQLIEDVRQLSEAQRRLLLKFVQLLKETPI